MSFRHFLAYYIAYSIQNSIETHNTKEALKTINHYIESLDKTNFVIYSDYSYFNMKFSALINSYKIKNVNVVVFINSIENKRFESKRFVNDLCLLIEDFVIEFYDSQAIHIQISQENNFTCLSLYTNTSIVNKNFISHQKLLNQYSYSFHNDNFTILKMIID